MAASPMSLADWFTLHFRLAGDNGVGACLWAILVVAAVPHATNGAEFRAVAPLHPLFGGLDGSRVRQRTPWDVPRLLRLRYLDNRMVFGEGMNLVYRPPKLNYAHGSLYTDGRQWRLKRLPMPLDLDLSKRFIKQTQWQNGKGSRQSNNLARKAMAGGAPMYRFLPGACDMEVRRISLADATFASWNTF